MELSQEEKERYRHAILTDKRWGTKLLLDLEKEDHQRFLQVCYQLADDPSYSVRWKVLALLGQKGDRGDAQAEAKAVEALAIPELVDVALSALGWVGTSTVLSTLFSYAQAGVPEGVRAVRRQVVKEEDTQTLVQLARQFITSPIYALREEALVVLTRLSSAEKEADYLLEAARLYYDELVLDVLGDATAKVLPALEKLQANFPVASAQYEDIQHAITRIKQRQV